MYISIDEAWLQKNMKKLQDASDEEGKIVITTDGDSELGELNDDNSLWLTETIEGADKGTKVWVSLDYKPKTNIIVALVENSIDDIKGDALVSIVELVVKKLNKFKSLIESVRGL